MAFFGYGDLQYRHPFLFQPFNRHYAGIRRLRLDPVHDGRLKFTEDVYDEPVDLLHLLDRQVFHDRDDVLGDAVFLFQQGKKEE